MTKKQQNRPNRRMQWAHAIKCQVKREGILLRTASLLLVLVLGSSYVLSGLLARYVSTDSGKDKARVAAFGELALSETEVALRLFAPGVDLEKDPKVSFGSEIETETAAWVFVELTLSNKWNQSDSNTEFYLNQLHTEADAAYAMSFAVADGWTYLTTKYYGDTGSTSYIFYCRVAAGESLESVSVLKDDKITVSDRIYYDEMSDLEAQMGNIEVTAYAVQAAGSEDAYTAWERLG